MAKTDSRRDEGSKRAAAHIASLLPDDKAEALRILDLAHDIIVNLGTTWGKRRQVEPAKPTGAVVRLATARRTGKEAT